MQYLILLSLAAFALSAPQQVPYVHQEIPAEPYVHAVPDPPFPGCLCPVCSPAGALCAPADPCGALCWRSYRLCWTCLDRWLCQQSRPGSSLQAVSRGDWREAVQSLEIDWPAEQSPKNGLAQQSRPGSSLQAVSRG